MSEHHDFVVASLKGDPTLIGVYLEVALEEYLEDPDGYDAFIMAVRHCIDALTPDASEAFKKAAERYVKATQ